MISFEEAHKIVLDSAKDFGIETVDINNCVGRVLAEDIKADRDFPPFNRVTKDGIAIKFETFESGGKSFKIESIAAAGSPQQSLNNPENCVEVMTGAMLPEGTDTVIMYEQTNTEDGITTILSAPKKGQNIHYQGIDQREGAVLLKNGSKIKTSSIGVIATVGKSKLKVKCLPKIAVISTGNELVPIDKMPEPHQIRTSNSLSLQNLLKEEGIEAELFHIKDDKEKIRTALNKINSEFDVIMMSGGVSKGKFDFLPAVLDEIGVEKKLHRVAQRPGKPFWFGVHLKKETTVFGFPGNPVSTYVNYHLYFKDWLYNCLGQSIEKKHTIFQSEFNGDPNLTRCVLVKSYIKEGKLFSELVNNNGSGDLVSLTKASGVVRISEGKSTKIGDVLEFIKF